MTSEQHARTKELFLAACERPPGEWSDFLDAACGGDAELRREVESLLRFHQESEGDGAGAATPLPDRFDDAAMPERIGPYRLLRKLGEGGMGVVFEAEQETPVRRRVALKLIKWGMETREVVARFESERQALAMMSHANVAKVLDAGATEQGRPYFVMELVDGVPITEHCDSHRLTTAERLQLFTRVCEGVQHAHQKGIIHRDLKPSNVLVAIEDGRPVPKIIDFGVAKATDQRLTERTVATRLGQWIGTPEYMSPEQAAMGADDIDTRTDVYSLGVMLYELLVGTVPFDSTTLGQASFDEMRRRIREEEPPRPSTKVSSLGDASRATAQSRRTEPHALVHALRGDLDWVTMKALEKDRSRRYGSAAELAADVERHLRNEPVIARPPSAAYRIGKFVRRNRVAVTAAAVVAAALVAGTVAATVGLLRARQEAQAARQASNLLISVFQEMDPNMPLGHSISVRGLLDLSAERVAGALADRPVEKARVMAAIGQVYCNLGHYDQARPLLEQAISLQREHLGAHDSSLVGPLASLAWLHSFKADYPAARRCNEESVAISEGAYGPDDTISLACRANLSWLLWKTGHTDQARTMLDQALARAERSLAADDPRIADLLYFRGIVLRYLGWYEESRQDLQRCLAIREEAFGPDHTGVGWALLDLGLTLGSLNRSTEARGNAERALAVQEKALGPDHMAVSYPLNQLGGLRLAAGDPEGARPLLERALAIRERTLGPDSPDVAWTLQPLADLARRAGDYDGALALLRRALAIQEAALGPNHPEVDRTLVLLAYTASLAGHHEEALALADRAEQALLAPSAPHNPRAAGDLYNLACMFALRGDGERALALLRRAVDDGFARTIFLTDSDLDSLRGDPRFAALVADVQERLGRTSR